MRCAFHPRCSRRPLTLPEYLDARPIADPLKLFDCVMPCAGAEGFLVMREDRARQLGIPLRASRHHRAAQRVSRRPDPNVAAGRWISDRLYSQAGFGPPDIDLFEAYDDYPVINCLQIRGPRLLPPRRGARPSSASNTFP